VKSLFVLVFFFSSLAFAGYEHVTGKIFLGGATFSQKNYLHALIQFKKTDQEVHLMLSPLKSWDECILEFGTGKIIESGKMWFSGDIYARYKIPVTLPCSLSRPKLYKLEIVYVKDTNEIKSLRLGPYRNGSYPYFSTEF